MPLVELDPRSLRENPFSLLADEWALLSSGDLKSHNALTVAWGGLGHLWNRDVAFAFVRPTRHTYGFLEERAAFSLNFFGGERREALALCGRLSGRDGDKEARAGLVALDAGGWTAYEGVRLCLRCRVLHSQDLDPARFLDAGIAASYPERDYHRMYVGAVEGACRWEPDA